MVQVIPRGLAPVGLSLASVFARGAWIWGIFLVIGVVVLGYACYTERGSGICVRAWGKPDIDAPGALGPGNAWGRDLVQDVRTWTRGVSTSRGRRTRPCSTTRSGWRSTKPG